MIPSNEFFTEFLFRSSSAVPVLGVFGSALVQGISWILLGWVTLNLVHSFSPVRMSMHSPFVSLWWAFQGFVIIPVVLLGTPFYVWLLPFMGSTVQGEPWHFGNATHDYHLLTFKDRTIVDDSHITGHFAIFNKITVASTVVGGVIHAGCYIPAGGRVTGPEFGPCKVCLGDQHDGETTFGSDALAAAPHV